MCTTNRSLSVSLVSFSCVGIVVNTEIKLYSIEVIKTSTSVLYSVEIGIAILLDTEKPRFRPIKAVVVVGSLNHSLGYQARDIVEISFFTIDSLIDFFPTSVKLCQTKLFCVGIEVVGS